jgi:hypothetical protein
MFSINELYVIFPKEVVQGFIVCLMIYTFLFSCYYFSKKWYKMIKNLDREEVREINEINEMDEVIDDVDESSLENGTRSTEL